MSCLPDKMQHILLAFGSKYNAISFPIPFKPSVPYLLHVLLFVRKFHSPNPIEWFPSFKWLWSFKTTKQISQRKKRTPSTTKKIRRYKKQKTVLWNRVNSIRWHRKTWQKKTKKKANSMTVVVRLLCLNFRPDSLYLFCDDERPCFYFSDFYAAEKIPAAQLIAMNSNQYKCESKVFSFFFFFCCFCCARFFLLVFCSLIVSFVCSLFPIR